MKSRFIPIFVLSLLSVPLVVLAVPSIPHQFYGLANFSNGPAPDGLVVEARIEGVKVASTPTLNGKYGYNPSLFFVTDPDNNRAGKTINFFISGFETGKSTTFSNGEHTNIDFSISGNFFKEISKSENETLGNQSVLVASATSTTINMGDKLEINISSPTNATATIEKIQKLESNFFTGATAVLAGQNALNAFEIKITGNISITITMSYSDTGIDENTIAPYRFDGTSWVKIADFTIDKTANKITFNISGQTPYVVFGSPPASPPPTGGTTGGGGGGGGGGGDTTAPSISAVNAIAGDTTATITWQTDEASLSWFVYGTTTTYGEEAKTTAYSTSHSVTLNDLSSATTYHYQIKSKDATGNIGSYTDKTFLTLASGEKITGDINKDNKIDIFDFNLIMVNWGNSPTNLAADLDKNGKVDIFDFNLLMVNWTG